MRIDVGEARARVQPDDETRRRYGKLRHGILDFTGIDGAPRELVMQRGIVLWALVEECLAARLKRKRESGAW